MAYFESPHTRTYDTDLGWLIRAVLKLRDTVKEISESTISIDEKLAAFQQVIDEIDKKVDELISGKTYQDLYIETIKDYLKNNLTDYVADLVKYVIFGIDNDGHFIACIPESWQFITFDTIVNSESPLYGHLILNW